MTARAQRKAQHLSSFCKLVVICLFVSSLLTQNSLAYTSYSRTDLLNIGSYYSYIDDLRLIPEIAKTTKATNPAPPTGNAHRRRRDRKQRRGKRGGLRAKLKLTPHWLSLPSIFLANIRSLANKMDELRLRITTHKWIMDCNILVFTETWLNSSVPDCAIELTGRHVLRVDRTADDSRKTRGAGLCIYVNKAWSRTLPSLRVTALLTWSISWLSVDLSICPGSLHLLL